MHADIALGVTIDTCTHSLNHTAPGWTCLPGHKTILPSASSSRHQLMVRKASYCWITLPDQVKANPSVEQLKRCWFKIISRRNVDCSRASGKVPGHQRERSWPTWQHLSPLCYSRGWSSTILDGLVSYLGGNFYILKYNSLQHIYEGNTGVMELLKGAGADPTIKNKNGQTAEQYAGYSPNIATLTASYRRRQIIIIILRDGKYKSVYAGFNALME